MSVQKQVLRFHSHCVTNTLTNLIAIVNAIFIICIIIIIIIFICITFTKRLYSGTHMSVCWEFVEGAGQL